MTPPSVHQVETDVIIIGGGAAGLMAAATAGQQGRRVVLLEHQERVGKKILISGGGRCNFTNLNARAENYLSGNPNFCKSALARYRPDDFIRLVEKHGVAYHEKKLGQQFCDGSSREIVDLLTVECGEAQVKIVTGCTLNDVSSAGEHQFVVRTSRGTWKSASVIVATGGLSFSKLGATDFGHRLARQFGLEVTPLRPGLVPLTFFPKDEAVWGDLSGLSLPVTVTQGEISFTEAMLWTHWGLSGPAILQISSYWRPAQPLEFNLLPDQEAGTWLEERIRGGHSVEHHLSELWPQRFLRHWSRQIGSITQRPLAQISLAEREILVQNLGQWQMKFAGTMGYPKAEVTCGGVSTKELSSKTLEARQMPGLYFIGEVVDVTGWLGGYNFQWAWASGRAAGQAA